MRKSIKTVSIVISALMFGLSACKQEQSADALQENAMVDGPVENTDIVNQVVEAPAVAEPVNAANVVAPPPAFTDSEQMRDDADATGLTARLPADDDALAPDSENETQPAK